MGSKRPGPWFNINMSSYQYKKSHCGDKTILRPSYLHNGISYTGKMTSLYWIKAQWSGIGPGFWLATINQSMLDSVTILWNIYWLPIQCQLSFRKPELMSIYLTYFDLSSYTANPQSQNASSVWVAVPHTATRGMAVRSSPVMGDSPGWSKAFESTVKSII